MKLTVTGRQVVVSEKDRRDLEARVAHLDRLLNDSAVSASCAVSRERQAFICELTIHVRGNHMLHAVGRHKVLDVAAGQAVAKLAQQAHKLKDRWKKRRRGGASAGRADTVGAPTAASGTDGGSTAPATRPPRVIRARAYEAKPMTVADAALVLSSSAQPVLVFRHAESDAVTVLYRRPDGHLGLIEPDR